MDIKMHVSGRDIGVHLIGRQLAALVCLIEETAVKRLLHDLLILAERHRLKARRFCPLRIGIPRAERRPVVVGAEIDVFAVVRQQRVERIHAVDIVAHLRIDVGEDVLLAGDADGFPVFPREHERCAVEDKHIEHAALAFEQVRRSRYIPGIDVRKILVEGRIGINAVADLDDGAKRYQLVVRVFPAPLRLRGRCRLRGRRRFGRRLCRVRGRLRRGCDRRRDGDLVPGGGVAVNRHAGIAVQTFQLLRGADPAVASGKRVGKPETDVGEIAPVRRRGEGKCRERFERALFRFRNRRAQREHPRDERQHTQREEKRQSRKPGALFCFFRGSRFVRAVYRAFFVVHSRPFRIGSTKTG